MDLFGVDAAANLLPYDGEVFYHGRVFAEPESRRIKETLLLEIPWEHDEAVMFGKRIVTARKVAWFADGGVSYSYSGTTKRAHAWSEDLLRLKKVAETLAGEAYNSCLLNLYHGGDEGMGWHSDDEKEIVPGSSIASLSLGVTVLPSASCRKLRICITYDVYGYAVLLTLTLERSFSA